MSRLNDPDQVATSQPRDGEPLLSVEDLRTVFYTDKEEIHAVDGISFDLHAGETVGLVGESGSGKSVTARSVLGLVDDPGVVESGAIQYKGDNLVESGWDKHRGDISIIFQDPSNALNPVYTVGNQIREALKIHQGLTGAKAKERAIELLEEVGIPDAPRRVKEYPHQFSGGMQQRAVIATALACDPDLLVCDEPTTALDVTTQAQILDLLRELQVEEDLAMLFITHDMGVIEDIADRVNVIYAGEIVERAPTETLLENPEHPYTSALLQSIPGRTDPDKELPTIEGDVPTPTGPADRCRFAPRCPKAIDECSMSAPETVTVDATVGHDAACIFAGEDTKDEESTETSRPQRQTGQTKRETLLQIENLKTYYEDGSLLNSNPPVKAVDGVSLEVVKGETLGLVGESGCGKTTLGRTLVGLESATGGAVTVEQLESDTDALDGADITQLSGTELRDWQRHVGMVFQDPQESLNDRQTIGEIIREPLDAHDWKTPAEREERVFELLGRVGLREEHFYRYPHQFSGGQRQRIGIARALALEPEFVILDEPVSALDVSVQARVINLLEEIQAEFGLTYLFIAHDLSVVRHIADRVAVMYLGNVMEVGPTERVFKNPSNPYTRSLLSAIPGSSNPGPQDLERITLRGTPPNPRYPPDGCPFTTRCPEKIAPAGHEDLSEEAFTAIETLRSVLRERARAGGGLSKRLKQQLGLGSQEQSIEAIVEDLFDDVEVSPSARAVIDEAAEHAETDPSKAREVMQREFESACDTESPAQHNIDGTEQQSRCLRHTLEYDEPWRTPK
jgi:peptide/nickel transport system ATP-binding protein